MKYTIDDMVRKKKKSLKYWREVLIVLEGRNPIDDEDRELLEAVRYTIYELDKFVQAYSTERRHQLPFWMEE
jgi:phage terminase small subunit